MIIINTVSVLRCESYEVEKLKEVIKKSLENLGGIDKYINKNEKVLLKTNLVMAKKPATAATSQPEFVQALAEILIEYGAQVMIGDSPGGAFNEIALKGVYRVCEMDKCAQKTGASLNFNTSVSEVSNPKGLILKRLTVANMIFDADKVISVARLKTHGMMKMTAAAKNMFGIIPGTIKAEYHLNRPDLDMFAEAMVDICLFANPVLSFIDGIVAMEGKGPTSGTPRKLNAVIASANPFAADLAAAEIIMNNPSSVPTINSSIKRGLCPDNVSKLNIIGDNISSFKVNDFKIPEVVNINPLKNILPEFAQSAVNSALQPKPVFIHDKCIACGACYENCPPKAITMIKKRPYVDLNKCIRCFCCQELCPKDAVDIKRPILYKIISKI